jgi:hypothetical protein
MASSGVQRVLLSVSEDQLTETERYLVAGINLLLERTEALLALVGERSLSTGGSAEHSGPSGSQTDTNSTVVDLPPAKSDDTLARSDRQRKRRRAIDQRLVLCAEPRQDQIVRPMLVGVDNNNKTYRAFIVDYVNKWRPYEVKYGPAWRVDRPITGRLPDGTTTKQKQNTRAAWYNVRRPMYAFFEFKVASGSSIETTKQEGEVVFKSAITSVKQARPSLQSVKKKFIEALASLNQRGSTPCVGARASILREEVTIALSKMAETLNKP